MAPPDTPIKARLKVVIKEQDAIIKKAKLDAENSESTIETLEGDLSEAGCKIISLQEEQKEFENVIKVLESEEFQLHRRKLVSKISSPGDNNEETRLVLTEMIKQNRDLFLRAAESARMPMLQMLSPEQAVNLKSLMRLPMNKIQNLRCCLSNLNMNMIPSEQKVRNAQAPLVAHVDKSSVEAGLIGLHQIGTDENVTPQPYVRVKNLLECITEILEKEEMVEDEKFEGKLWLLFWR